MVKTRLPSVMVPGDDRKLVAAVRRLYPGPGVGVAGWVGGAGGRGGWGGGARSRARAGLAVSRPAGVNSGHLLVT
jgi:hypothetical protein